VKRVFLMNVGSLGDLHPFIGMGLALRNAGFDVVVGTNASHVPRVKAAGLEGIGIGPDLRPDDPELISVVMNPRRGPVRLHRDYIFPATERAIDDALPAARASDLILTGILGYVVPTLSELAKVPWGMGMLAPLGFWSAHDPPETPAIPFLRALKGLGPRSIRVLYKLLFAVSGGLAKPLQQARKRRGLPPQPNPFLVSTMTGGDLNLALFSKHFAAPQPDWPANLVQPGYIAYDGPGGDSDVSVELDRFLASGEPPILVTLGSTNVLSPGEIFEIVHRAVKPTGRRALFLVGAQRLTEYREKFEGDRFGVFDYAPYSKVMPRCSVVVHQGGAGTTGHCLRASRPAVIVGSANDQLDNARHVEGIGAGVRLPLSLLTTSTLTRALDHAESAEVRARAAQIGALIAAENAEESVVQAVRAVIGDS
jgi:rhamnosyltransferase subunit B